MSPKLYVLPLTEDEHRASKRMEPLMRFLIGDKRESPQETHWWNNTKLKPGDIAHLRKDYLVTCTGDRDAVRRWWNWIPLFHLTRFGGWKKYAVLKPVKHVGAWHVGWIAKDVIGVSRIESSGPVRVLLGPGECTFFGVSAYNHVQLPIHKIGSGRIGDGGLWRGVQLL